MHDFLMGRGPFQNIFIGHISGMDFVCPSHAAAIVTQVICSGLSAKGPTAWPAPSSRESGRLPYPGFSGLQLAGRAAAAAE